MSSHSGSTRLVERRSEIEVIETGASVMMQRAFDFMDAYSNASDIPDSPPRHFLESACCSDEGPVSRNFTNMMQVNNYFGPATVMMSVPQTPHQSPCASPEAAQSPLSSNPAPAIHAPHPRRLVPHGPCTPHRSMHVPKTPPAPARTRRSCSLGSLIPITPPSCGRNVCLHCGHTATCVQRVPQSPVPLTLTSAVPKSPGYGYVPYTPVNTPPQTPSFPPPPTPGTPDGPPPAHAAMSSLPELPPMPIFGGYSGYNMPGPFRSFTDPMNPGAPFTPPALDRPSERRGLRRSLDGEMTEAENHQGSVFKMRRINSKRWPDDDADERA